MKLSFSQYKRCDDSDMLKPGSNHRFPPNDREFAALESYAVNVPQISGRLKVGEPPESPRSCSCRKSEWDVFHSQITQAVSQIRDARESAKSVAENLKEFPPALALKEILLE